MNHVTLLDALRGRRSRRFGAGMEIPAGPLAYKSKYPPVPLTEAEEAALVFAACGITGPALADLCFAPGGGGAIMAGLTGRTIASGDGIQTVALFVTNDNGTCFIKRPQDFPLAEIPELIDLARKDAFTELYQKMRVRKSDDRRAKVPLDPLFNINANRWSVHAPGTTYFLPVNDLTLMYINGLLEIFNDETCAFILDERHNFLPAGLGRFARSKGGHLDDDPKLGRVLTIVGVERFVAEFCTVEQGMMLQNLGLMTQALGLGGFPNFANHETAWFDALGFDNASLPLSDYLGAGFLASIFMSAAGKNSDYHFPIALRTKANEMLLKAYCPPNYPTMRAAVEAVVELKYGASGVFRRKGPDSRWVEPDIIKAQIPRVSQNAINATIAYCEYVFDRYHRFPAYMPPFRTVLGFQACHLDLDFYDHYYKAEAITPLQREDFAQNVKKARP